MTVNGIRARLHPAFAAAALILSAASFCLAGGFAPKHAPYGFFGGGGDCPQGSGKTPVVFIHGNANSAGDWNRVLADYREAGYDDCRLYGVTWLSPERKQDPFSVVHDAAGAKIIADFIEDVKRYTGSAQVDVVAHSMGVTQSLSAIESFERWRSIRKFIAIAGALRGLESCRTSPLATCSSEFKADPEKFGFLPADAPPADARQERNQKMGADGFRAAPGRAASTIFYSISDGRDDEVLCMAPATNECLKTARFSPSSNVVSQLTVATPGGKSFHHFQVRDATGPVQLKMLDTDCKGFECAAP